MTDQELLSHFLQQADGTWACISPVQINGPSGNMAIVPGEPLRRGEHIMGINVAAELDAAAERLGRGAGL